MRRHEGGAARCHCGIHTHDLTPVYAATQSCMTKQRFLWALGCEMLPEYFAEILAGKCELV